jgi:hypothetical protein
MDMDDGTLSQAAFSGLYKNISGHFSHILYFKKKFHIFFFPPSDANLTNTDSNGTKLLGSRIDLLPASPAF